MSRYDFMFATQTCRTSITVSVDAESEADAGVELVKKIEGLREQGVCLPVNNHMWHLFQPTKSDGVY